MRGVVAPDDSVESNILKNNRMKKITQQCKRAVRCVGVHGPVGSRKFDALRRQIV